MVERTPFSVVVVDRKDRTVTLHGESIRLPLVLGPVGFVYEYRRPRFVIDRRDGRETRRRIVDSTVGLRILVLFSAVALILSRRRNS